MSDERGDAQESLFAEPVTPSKKAPKEPMLYIVPATKVAQPCRGENCRKPVYFVYLKSAGRFVVVDCTPVYAPNHRTKANQKHPSAPKCFPPVHPKAPGEYFGMGMDGQGIDHHATCADVRQFGRKTERKNG